MKIIHEIINRGKGSYGLGQNQLTRDELLRIYDETRSITSLILTTSGTTGPATFNQSTGVLNIPNYTQAAVSGFVPYTGATANVDLGDRQLITDAIQFNLVPSALPAVGKMKWNPDAGTMDIGMGYPDVIQQVGMETYYPPVKNQTGSTITNGTVVMAVGTLGASGRILIAPAVADGSVPSRFMLGITTHDIANGGDGVVTWFGLVRGFNTTAKAPVGETWVDGDVLWINPAIPGGLTNVEPSAPNIKVSIALVVHAGTNGIIMVRPFLGMRLTDLHDVNAFTPSTNDLLVFNSVKWESASRESIVLNTPITGYTVGANTALADTDTILQAFGKVQGQINARISGTIASGQVAFGTGSGTIGGDSGLTWDNTNKELLITDVALKRSASNSFVINAGINSIEANTIRSLISGGGDSLFPNKIGFATKPNGTDFTPTGWSDDSGYVANSAQVALIAGGYDHVNNQIGGTIVGGGHNFLKYNLDGHGVIGGGSYNLISAGRSGIFSGRRNTVTGSFIFSGVFGGDNNNIASSYSFIGSGLTNSISGNYSSILSGANNSITSQFSAVSGGNLNSISANYSLAHGQNNNISAAYGVVFGEANSISVVGASYSAILGGNQNIASGFFSTVLAGRRNQATGNYSYAAGRRSISSGEGAWSISDSQDADNTNSIANSFRARFSGGYRFTGGNFAIGEISPTNTLDVNGTARIRTISNLGSAATSVLVPDATGVLNLRTVAELRSDIGAIGGTIASGQVAFGTGVNTVGGSNNLFWDNANVRFGIGTNSPNQPFELRLASNPIVLVTATANTTSAIFQAVCGTTTLQFRANGEARATSASTSQLSSTGNLELLSNGISRVFISLAGTTAVGINTVSPSNTLDVNGTARIRTISNLGTAATSVLVPDATGVLNLRTVAELRSDIGAIGGTIASGQVAFGTGVNTVGGVSTFEYDSANFALKINVAGTITSAGRSILALGGTSGGILSFYQNTTRTALFFSTGNVFTIRNDNGGPINFESAAGVIRWSVLTGGELESPSTATFRTATGTLTIATNGGDGNILLRPNGTGLVGINLVSPTNTLDVNGTTRIRTISNLGSAATEVMVPDATGVVSKRTRAEFLNDMLSNISGFNASATQTLRHVSGVYEWVNI